MSYQGFIDKYSAKCLLGPMSKDFSVHGEICTWKVKNTNHFSICGGHELNLEDLDYLRQFGSLNFHYLSDLNCSFLTKNLAKVKKERLTSYIIGINEINYSGNKNKTIRNYMNRYGHLQILDDYKQKKDLGIMLNEWADTLGEKYYWSFHGKTKYFLENNFHSGCDSVFVYDGDKLVSFGVASPVENCYCSYVIGKALSKTYPGLSEFTDMKLYEKVFAKYGRFEINLGKAEGGLVFYKKKFSNSKEELCYAGNVKF